MLSSQKLESCSPQFSHLSFNLENKYTVNISLHSECKLQLNFGKGEMHKKAH